MRGESLRRGGRRVVVVLGSMLGVCLIASCKGLGDAGGGAERRAHLLREGDLTLVMGRLERAPDRVVTAAERVAVRVYFDPQLADLGRAAGYTLWRLDGKERQWEKLGSTPSIATPYELALPEGEIGLRASVNYADGKEALVPKPGDQPALWLVADRTPPSLAWVEPAPGAPLRSWTGVLHLRWTATEAQFGTAPFRLEWSADRGATWKPIANVPAAPGGGRFRWTPPEEATGEVVVRVQAEDLAGHPATALLPLAASGRAPPEALAAAGAAGSPAGTAGASDPAAGAAAGATEVSGAAVVPSGGPDAVEGAPLPSAAGAAATEASQLEPGVAKVEAAAVPPQLVTGEIPRNVGAAGLALTVTARDVGGGAGFEGVDAYLRPAGTGPWKLLPPEKVCLAAGQLTLDLAHFEEGLHEICLRPVDRAGNVVSAPEASSPPLGQFHLDLTPPELAVRAPPLALVSGFRSEVELKVDWSDAVPPLLAEGLDEDGRWVAIEKWSRPAPAQNLFSFPVPGGAKKYTVRFSLADAAGNRGQALVGPQAVESPIRLLTFGERRDYRGRTSEAIRWELHPVAHEMQEELRVNVWHQVGSEGEWALLFEGMPAASVCYWDLPAGEPEGPAASGAAAPVPREHCLRLALLRGGQEVGEARSAFFRVVGGNAVPPTVVPISQESQFYFEQGRTQLERHRAALAAREQGVDNASEVESLAASVTAHYRKACDLDPRNYQAAYALAQFLNQRDARANAAQVLDLLLQTVKVKPDHFWALNDLGALYIRDGVFDKAQETLSQAALVKPMPIVLYNLGLTHFYRGDMVGAREKFQAALAAEGGEAAPRGEIYYYIVHSYLQEGDMDRARSLLRENEAAIPSDLRADLAARL